MKDRPVPSIPAWQDPALPVERIAEILGIPPETVAGWRTGVSRPTYGQRIEIEEMVAMERWHSALNALSLPECPELSRLVEVMDSGRISLGRGLDSLDRHEQGCALCQANRRRELEMVGPMPIHGLSFAESYLRRAGPVGALCRLVHRPAMLPVTLGLTALILWRWAEWGDLEVIGVLMAVVAAGLSLLSIRSLRHGPAD